MPATIAADHAFAQLSRSIVQRCLMLYHTRAIVPSEPGAGQGVPCLVQFQISMRERGEISPGSVPFNCVDKCLLALDGINEPMLFHLVLHLQGNVNHARLYEAISSAQRVHPVMRTVLRMRRLKWVRQIEEDVGRGVLTIANQAQAGDMDYLSSWMNQPLNPWRDFPVRVLLLAKGEAEHLLVFTFHHSSADGLRALLFVRTTVEIYNSEPSRDRRAAPFWADSLADLGTRRRGDELLQFAHSQRTEVGHYYRKVIFSLLRRFVAGTFLPPTRLYHDRSGTSRELRSCLTVMSHDELELIQARARAAGVTLNDILVAACFRTVEKWNGMHGKASNRIRIMIPVNVGLKGFGNIISNQASWFSLPTTPRDRADQAELLRKVSTGTAQAIANRTAFSLIYYFYMCSRFPLFVMRWICRFLIGTRIYIDTILITNVGFVWPKSGSREAAVSTMGDARIANVSGFAPVVTPMGLSIVACTYNGNLNLSLTYRPALFSGEKAEMFLRLYFEEVRDYEVGVGSQ